jgi:ElaB/YqjD/DUF883 family membrane-anchored ribosome-binding protein
MDQRTGSSSGSVGKKQNGNGGTKAGELAEAAGVDLDELRNRVGDVNDRIVGFIKERPGTSILIALGAGFLIGRLLRS